MTNSDLYFWAYGQRDRWLDMADKLDAESASFDDAAQSADRAAMRQICVEAADRYARSAHRCREKAAKLDALITLAKENTNDR